MTADKDRVLAELPLPLAADAGLTEALGIAVALEDGLAITLPDEFIDVAHLGRRVSIEATLDVVELNL